VELQLIQRVAGDDRCQRLIPNPQAHLAEQAVGAYFLDKSAEAIAAAQRHDEPRRPPGRSRFRLGGRRLPGEQAVDFRLGQPVMAAGGGRRANLALKDPLLQRRVPDAHSFGGGPHG
jgi:hypothetical protein